MIYIRPSLPKKREKKNKDAPSDENKFIGNWKSLTRVELNQKAKHVNIAVLSPNSEKLVLLPNK